MSAKSKLSTSSKILPFLCLILFSCNQKTFEEKIVSEIKNNCKKFPCSIKISKTADFEWDKLYIFNYGVSSKQIEEISGIYVREDKKFTRKIIFTRKDELVHYEELQTNIEGIENNQVYFDDVVDRSYRVYSIKNDNFQAQEFSEGKITYYQLNQNPF